MICGTNCDGKLIKAGVFSDFLKSESKIQIRDREFI